MELWANESFVVYSKVRPLSSVWMFTTREVHKTNKETKKNEMKKHKYEIEKTELKKGSERRNEIDSQLRIVVIKLVHSQPGPSKKISSFLLRNYLLSNLPRSWNFDRS